MPPREPLPPFEQHLATRVIGGVGVAQRCGELANLFGERVLLVRGGDSGIVCGARADVIRSLELSGMAITELEGIASNPGVSVAQAGAVLARAECVQVIVAVGGGSVIDVAKAISVGATTHAPIREQLSGLRSSASRVDATIPVIAVPTIAGSGSEVNGTSVLVDELTGRKLSMHEDLAAPRVALLDPAYPWHAPPQLRAEALADALCHAIESGLSPRASAASDALARAAMGVLEDHAATAVRDDDVRHAGAAGLDAMLRCMHAAGLASCALTMSGSIATHPLSHPVSARYGVHHGAAVAALEAAVIMSRASRWGVRAAPIARWMGSRVPLDSSAEEAADALVVRLARWNRNHGVKRSVADLGVDEALFDDLVADALESGSRGLTASPETAWTAKELRSVLEQAYSTPPHIRRKLRAANPLTRRRPEEELSPAPS